MAEGQDKRSIFVVGEAYASQLCSLDHVPGPGESLMVEDAKMVPGGRGVNACLLLRSLGADCSICTRIGTDAGGRLLSAFLASKGVDNRWMTRSDRIRTGSETMIQIRGEAYRSAINPGASAQLTAEDVSEALCHLNPDAMLISANLPADTVIDSLEEARRCGALLYLDAFRAPADFPFERLNGMELDFLQLDEKTYCRLLRLDALNESNLIRSAIQFQGMVKKRSLVIRRDDGSAVIFIGNVRRVMGAVENHPILDPHTASDAFTAAFVYSLLLRRQVSAVCDLAEYIYALTVSGAGASLSVPSRETIINRAAEMRDA